MVWKCYLYFDSASEGSLFTQWSETSVPNHLAALTPTSKLPGYLTQDGGRRQELVRNLSASRVQNFYRGFAEFIKEGAKYDSTLSKVDTDGGSKLLTTIVFLNNREEVKVLGEAGEAKIKDYIAVAVMPAANNIFQGVKTVSRGKFVDSVTQRGYYAIKY